MIQNLFFLGALLFAGFLLTTVSSYQISRNAIRTSILESELPLSSNNIYSEVQRDLVQPILISSLMAHDTFVKRWIEAGETNEAAIIEYLAEIQRKYGTVTAFFISETTRKYYNARMVLKKVGPSDPVDTWFFRLRRQKEDYEINVDPDLSNNNAMTIFINHRVLDHAGQFVGATGVGLSVSAVKSLMQEYRVRYHRDVYFYDQNGNLILHSQGGESSDGRLLSDHRADESRRLIQEGVDRGEKDTSTSAVGRNGAMVNYRYIPELNWILVVEQISDGTLSLLLKTVGMNLLFCLATSVAFLGIIRKTTSGYQKELELTNQQLLKRRDQLLESNAAREKLFSIIGHDLRAPIAGVRTFLDLLHNHGMAAANFNDFAARLTMQVDHVLVALDNLLKWGDVLHTSLQPRPETVDLRAISEESIGLLDLFARSKRIQVDNAIPEGAIVRADVHQIQSVFRNLLSNAIKFTPDGGEVAFSAVKEPGWWRISVADNGIGIETEPAARIFEGLASTLGTGGERGFGLGLRLCRDFVELNGGKLSVQSSSDQGSTFIFTIPEATVRDADTDQCDLPLHRNP